MDTHEPQRRQQTALSKRQPDSDRRGGAWYRCDDWGGYICANRADGTDDGEPITVRTYLSGRDRGV